MSTEAIPASPAPLSADEAEAMLQRRLKKHDVAIVLLHWFNAATWVLLVATGAALVVSPYFRIAPEWYTTLVESIFGGRASLLTFHIALGLTWIGVFLVYGIFGFRSYLHHEVLRKEIALDRDDWRWLLVRTLGILGRSAGLMIHVYMAAVFPEEKPAFFSMITGSVHELYAYSHHFEWWREEKEKQVARRAGSGSRGEGPGESAVAGGREGLRTD
jgi:cytochrome b subunit of formate dehydrogenase